MSVNSRGKGVVLLHAADAFALSFLRLGLVVKVELVEAVGKRQ